MPTGPKGQKRPADVISAAVKVMRIATGQEGETGSQPKKSAAGRLGGLKGGKARATGMTPEQRKSSASKAARARWEKPR